MKKYLMIAFLLSFQMQITAQEAAAAPSADDVARELSNPVSSLASLTFQGTYAQWGGSLEGVSNQNTSALVFMPTLPIKMKKGNISLRPSFPVSAVPTINEHGEWEKVRGFGEIGLMGIYGNKTEKGLLWGVGATMFFPTASKDELGKNQFQIGPAALIGILKKWGVLGILWQHWWGVGNIEEGDTRVNVGTAQLFYWFGVGGGWQVGGSPIPTANYVSSQDIDFSVPLNLGVAKTVVLGKMPLKFTLQGQYFVTRPDLLGPSWGIFFQITPVIKVPW